MCERERPREARETGCHFLVNTGLFVRLSDGERRERAGLSLKDNTHRTQWTLHWNYCTSADSLGFLCPGLEIPTIEVFHLAPVNLQYTGGK